MLGEEFPEAWEDDAESDGEALGIGEESAPYRVVRRFEDLIAWQHARELCRLVYEVTRSAGFRRDASLVDQMRRSAISVMSNIAEGHERATPPEFHRFLLIAQGSCGELRCQFYAAHDAGYLDEPTFNRMREDAERTGRIIGALRVSVAKRIEERRSSR